MTTKTTGSHAKFWVLLKQTDKYNEAYKELIKESWVSDYSGGKHTSLSGFRKANSSAYNRMLRELEETVKGRKKIDKDRQNAQRRKLLALIYNFCNHKDYTCSQQQAIKIACKSCGVSKFNDASEQKLIAAIKAFKTNEAEAFVDSVLDKVTEEFKNETGRE